MTPATLDATLSCSSKMSSSEPSNRSAQRCSPPSASINWAVIRTRFAGFAHRTFEHVADAQFAPDLLHIDGPTLVSEARVAGGDEQPADAAEVSS
jgi:hypothetical protein